MEKPWIQAAFLAFGLPKCQCRNASSWPERTLRCHGIVAPPLKFRRSLVDTRSIGSPAFRRGLGSETNTMRIPGDGSIPTPAADSLGVPQIRIAPRAPIETEANPAADRVAISDTARLVSRLRTEIGDPEEIDTGKVAQLRAQVQANTYSPSPQAVAERLLQDLATQRGR